MHRVCMIDLQFLLSAAFLFVYIMLVSPIRSSHPSAQACKEQDTPCKGHALKILLSSNLHGPGYARTSFYTAVLGEMKPYLHCAL